MAMKTEETTTPAPSQASPQTPTAQTTYATQWASTLQQSAQASQYYSAYTSHYPQAAYATHYQAYAPPVAAATTAGQAKLITGGQTQYQTSTYSLGIAGPNSSTTNNPIDSSDIATLNDALGSAGVDLRAEEESLQQPGSSSHQSYAHRSYEDRTRKQAPKPSFDNRILGTTMRSISTTHKISTIPEESVTYLALCLRARLQDLIVGMINAANHRTDTTFDRPASLFEGAGGGNGTPMWSILIRSDVAKQLAALEKAEREEETRIRKERKERADLQAAHAAALAAQANSGAVGGSSGVAALTGDGTGVGDDHDGMGGGGSAKKKRKKEGPGVTARNMSEDVRKKMSNAVATQAAGLGGRYAWMTAANATSAPPPKPKPATAVATATTTPATTMGPATTTTMTTTPPTTTSVATASTIMANLMAPTGTTTTSSWARPYIPIAKKSATNTNYDSAEHDTRTTITMRDAMFVIEKERGHGGGRGSARGWT